MMARLSENLVFFLALMGASVSAEMADPASVLVGDDICFEGFVMDNFCIERGTLLDVSLLLVLSFIPLLFCFCFLINSVVLVRRCRA